MLKADGFDQALLGVVRRCGQPDILCYDIGACAEILIERDGLDYSEAFEYLEHNSIGAWVGPETPAWLERTTLEEIEEREA